MPTLTPERMMKIRIAVARAELNDFANNRLAHAYGTEHYGYSHKHQVKIALRTIGFSYNVFHEARKLNQGFKH